MNNSNIIICKILTVYLSIHRVEYNILLIIEKNYKQLHYTTKARRLLMLVHFYKMI